VSETGSPGRKRTLFCRRRDRSSYRSVLKPELPQKQWTHQAISRWDSGTPCAIPAKRRHSESVWGFSGTMKSCGVRMTRDGGYHETITLLTSGRSANTWRA